ncbi:TetR/AcrR family transcriptional regulator [Paenibacillus chibensis]|uniref:TetR/AcrR family transcriptional regulator n=1 Tax=Paenibacillus chibensis TaxID=59846 RepID=UPI000FD85993|nr:TetR/AcrR family transcriptional regulator [Paenibacillus chibensis]MEC0370427.1 TetR/AcrR family transcriptional regulator [Paenibacillus chibensis]
MTEQKLDRRARRTREAIQAAFVELILEKGYDAVTIQEVADKADYNRGTFYKHYVGKEELLKEIREVFLKGIREALLRPYKGMDQVEATKIYPSTLKLFEHIECHKKEFKALITVHRGISEDLYNTLKTSMREDMHMEMEPGDPPLDYELMLSYRLSATVGVIMHWADMDFKYSAEYMADQLLALVNSKIDHIVFKTKP